MRPLRVVYADSVFTLNAVMDYLVLAAASKLAGLPENRGRYLLAALLGGGYATAVFLPNCGWLGSWMGKLAAGFLMGAVAFWGMGHLARLILLTFVLSCALAGCVLALSALTGSSIPMAGGVFYTDMDVRVLLTAASGAYFLLTAVFRASARHGVQKELLVIRLRLNHRTVKLTALQDSGNGLVDPVSGHPVLVADSHALDALWSPSVARLMARYPQRGAVDLLSPLHEVAPELHFRLLPYSAVGVTCGLLLAFQCTEAYIGKKPIRNLTVAVSPTALGDGYCALWGTETGGKHENRHKTSCGTGSSGAAIANKCSLHRRQ